MKRLAIIPARAGSKRVPRKNIKDFCGKPMIAHMIKVAQDSDLFDVIHVSTDSDEVAKIAAKCGAKPDFPRPEKLADDHTPLMEVLKFTVAEYKKKKKNFDTVALLYATSPLADPAGLKKACRQFEDGDGSRALLSVTPYPAPIEKAFRMMMNGALVPDDADAFARRSQDLKPAYHDAAMFCFYTPDFIAGRKGAGDFRAFAGYAVPPQRVTDIDTPEDWARAEAMFRALANKKKSGA
jgi:N-acylneuraminate cytidylyltransferase